MRWDPAQYSRFTDERSRPFMDLIARVDVRKPRRVVDIGCGPGNLTALLARRWPTAAVEGIDSSADMIESAAAHASDQVRFRLADAGSYQPAADTDLIVSNAALQWVPGHRELLGQWSSALPFGGWLAVQLPGNFGSPSHVLLRELAASGRWAEQLRGTLRHHDAVSDPQTYAQLLMRAGLNVDVWETTYLHLLTGNDPVLEWMRGTGLRPVLARLSEADGLDFSHEYAALLSEAYPSTAYGTLLPFRRVFAVGRRS